MDNTNILTRLIREANKAAQCYDCDIKTRAGTVHLSHKNGMENGALFDVRVEEARDPVGKHLMSVKRAGTEERCRVFATADGSVLFGVLYAWE